MKISAIVLLHGWGGSSASMEGLAADMSSLTKRVFTPDLPGFGRAEPPQTPWDVDDYVRWLRATLDQKKLTHVVLIGHSFGGHIAARFAGVYPSQVRALVLLAPSGIRHPLNHRQRLAQRLSTIPRLFGLGRVLSLFAPLVYLLAGERDYVRSSPMMKQTMQKVLAQDIRPILRRIKTPTLIIWGQEDQVTPVADADVIKHEVKRSKLVILDHAKHGLPLTHAEVITKEIKRFLQKGQ